MTSLLWLFPICADADIIYLKDGTKVRTAKVWEEGDVIRFSLEDYEDIIITYSKEIVERIEKGKGQAASRPTKQKDKDSAAQKDAAAGETGKPKGTAAESKKPAEVVDSSERSSERVGTGQPTKTGQADVAPQPPAKQTRQTTGPKTDKPAKTAHAKAKVEPQAHTITKKVPPAGVPSSQVDGILFYNPRRPYKFWTGATSKHRTLKQALEALAKQYDRPSEWVKAHMGESNDLGEIHKNLVQSKKKEN